MITIQAKAPTGLRATLGEDGAIQVYLGERLAADGHFDAVDGAGDFALTSAPLGKPTSRTVERASDTRFTATSHYPNTRVVTTLDLAGEDVTLTTVLTNLHPFGGPSFRCVKFGGLALRFTRPPAGRLPAWHITFTQHHGLNVMHPGELAPLGVAYAFDDTLGVSAFLPSHIRRRKLIWAEFDSNFANRTPPESRLWIATDDETPPQAATQVITSLRFSGDTSWKHLLEPYRAELAHEPLAYEPDDRPVARFASVDPGKVSLDNPFGYNGDARRFDKLEGIDAFIKMTAAPLAQSGGLGCLFWAIQGQNPRGAMYRPDFDVFPPQVEALLPLLVKSFKNRGLRVGLCTRPGESVERLNWKEDSTTRIRASAREQIDRTLARFKWATDRGFDMFYLDSFGNTYDDYLIMRDLRAALGPKVLCWAEWTSDIMLPLAGRYSEWHETDLVLHSHELAEIYQWLVPGCSYLVYDRVSAKPGSRPALSAEQYSEHHYTPLFEDFQAGERVLQVAAINNRFLQNRRWRVR